ncbi:MAG: transcription-repair coupling factor, partial [Pseudomonadota bacterium]
IDFRQFETWSEFIKSTDRIGVTVAPIDKGFTLEEQNLCVIAEEQLFGDRVRQKQKRRGTRDTEAIIKNLTDLNVGAPVVHDQYGIGRYQGLTVLEIAGTKTEFLELWYAGDDKLYVPVHALHLITRYTGTNPDKAPLHRLGGDQWQKAKRKAAEKIRDTAAELLDVYARRAARVGYAYHSKDHEYNTFADQFPFEPTPDQVTAFDSIRIDMQNSTPMDRVVCGDVGFGKTEVALRAAFTATMEGKQVAVLVPTTLLAQQHLQNFVDRFADWPVHIEVLSRFRSKKQSDQVLRALVEGTVDIVIGTHKLLQDQVKFKDLGLIIVDEEHRFGVRHKERLKALRSEVDILTLTATPIPRTLNMALGGLRELSLIATPPTERLAVKTFVSEWNDTMIREACIREIRRGGQVYFVHNEVKTIENVAQQLEKLVPEAKLRIGHGQMRERELEQIMLDFYHRRFNLLLCTTIIESGIDVPTANTIIIHRADRFGLAQLHQLRGRVGRSHHRAYAYLIAPPKAALTGDAEKRLAAIESMEDLGAGFTLATHDLEIRGAGELLGEEQSGQIQEIGFTLYMELLERAVKDLKQGKDPDLTTPLHHGVEVELNIPALIPDDYIPDVHLRLILYKRIASTETKEELRELQVEMIDRFGLLPPPTKTLFAYASLRQKAKRLGIQSIKATGSSGKVTFSPETSVEPATLVTLIEVNPGKYRLEGQDGLRFTLDEPDADTRIEQVEHLLNRLSKK